MENNKILFAKSREDVIIPTKTNENAGYDLYANFDDFYEVIEPQQTVVLNTGLHTAFSPDFVAIVKERGSTIKVSFDIRAGVIDSGYRGEWKIAITNDSNDFVVISKLDEKETINWAFGNHKPENVKIYPYSKAIAQFIMVEVPRMESKEISLDELQAIPSERGAGRFGSSGK